MLSFEHILLQMWLTLQHTAYCILVDSRSLLPKPLTFSCLRINNHSLQLVLLCEKYNKSKQKISFPLVYSISAVDEDLSVEPKKDISYQTLLPLVYILGQDKNVLSNISRQFVNFHLILSDANLSITTFTLNSKNSPTTQPRLFHFKLSKRIEIN